MLHESFYNHVDVVLMHDAVAAFLYPCCLFYIKLCYSYSLRKNYPFKGVNIKRVKEVEWTWGQGKLSHGWILIYKCGAGLCYKHWRNHKIWTTQDCLLALGPIIQCIKATCCPNELFSPNRISFETRVKKSFSDICGRLCLANNAITECFQLFEWCSHRNGIIELQSKE